MPIHVGVVSLELHVPGARSLKDKRRTVRSLIDRMHKRYRVSVAETGYHELHQRSEVTVAVVASDGGELERLLDGLREIAEGTAEAVLLRWEPRWLDDHDLTGSDLITGPGKPYGEPDPAWDEPAPSGSESRSPRADAAQDAADENENRTTENGEAPES